MASRDVTVFYRDVVIVVCRVGRQSQALWFAIPALDLVTDNSNSGEEVSHEQNEEAESAHPDLVSQITWRTMRKHYSFHSLSFSYKCTGSVGLLI